MMHEEEFRMVTLPEHMSYSIFLPEQIPHLVFERSTHPREFLPFSNPDTRIAALANTIKSKDLIRETAVRCFSLS